MVGIVTIGCIAPVEVESPGTDAIGPGVVWAPVGNGTTGGIGIVGAAMVPVVVIATALSAQQMQGSAVNISIITLLSMVVVT